MEQLNQFLAMGGYAAFVWPSYAFAALVMGGLAWSSRREMTRRARALAALEASLPRRAARAASSAAAAEAPR